MCSLWSCSKGGKNIFLWGPAGCAVYLTPRELMLALYTDKEGTVEEKLGIFFDMYDVDKNNALDMKEIKKMITAIKSQVDSSNSWKKF